MKGGRVVAVTSGKGGVGKSTVVSNLAIAMAKLGRKVLVLDADFSLANIDVLLGLAPRRTIQHFFTGECELEDLVVEGPAGIHLIPAASGISDLAHIDSTRRLALLQGLEALRAAHDIVLVDAPAGIGDNVVDLAAAADRAVVVVTPEPTSLVDAYATIKVIAGASAATAGGSSAASIMGSAASTEAQPPGPNPLARIGLLVNSTKDDEETRTVHLQIDRVCRRFLGSGIELIGAVNRDERVESSIREQRAVVIAHPHSPASRCFNRIALTLGRLASEGDPATRPLFSSWLAESTNGTLVH